jgi:histone demethylase JARID1
MEEAMRDALPHLFAASPGLLYQLVTMVSPTELRKRGIPVYRVVHEAGSFVVTMPNAYHAGFNTGFNCAEAVNFAAPAWLPYGTDVAQKYRDSRKPATMSHDSLLVALATAAQHVDVKLPESRDQQAPPPENGDHCVEPDRKPTPSPEDIGEDADLDGFIPGEGATVSGQREPSRRSSRKTANTSSQNQDHMKTGFGPLGDIPWQDAPLEGIILGTGELALRADEERQRWATGLAALGLSSLPRRAMDNNTDPGSKDASGVHTNTAECDCAECEGDLWLAAVVSGEAPGVAVCPEHAAVLVKKRGCSVQSLQMLCRHSPDELQALVAEAAARIEEVNDAVRAAFIRRDRHEAERVRAVTLGPLYETVHGRLLGDAQPRRHKGGKKNAQGQI